MAQNLESDILTVSLGSWMDLPGLTMSEWSDTEVGKRVSFTLVADYYKKYVQRMSLDKNFLDFAEVTSVRKVDDYSSLWGTPVEEANTLCKPESKRRFESRITDFNRDPLQGLKRDHDLFDIHEMFQFSDEASFETAPANAVAAAASASSTFVHPKSASTDSCYCSDPECCCSLTNTMTPSSLPNSVNTSESPEKMTFCEDDNLQDETYSSGGREAYTLSQTPAGILMREAALQTAKTKCCLKAMSIATNTHFAHRFQCLDNEYSFDLGRSKQFLQSWR